MTTREFIHHLPTLPLASIAQRRLVAEIRLPRRAATQSRLPTRDAPLFNHQVTVEVNRASMSLNIFAAPLFLRTAGRDLPIERRMPKRFVFERPWLKRLIEILHYRRSEP